MARARDTQRSKLYTAERLAGAFTMDLGERPSIADAQRYIDTVCRSPWTRRTFGRFEIEARVGRGSAMAHGDRLIFLGIPCRTRMVILHEVAHCIAHRRHPGVAGHGREFAAIYLDLVQHFLGVARAKALRAAFRANRVRVGKKRTAGGNAGNMAGLIAWRAARAAATTPARPTGPVFNPAAELAIARANGA